MHENTPKTSFLTNPNPPKMVGYSSVYYCSLPSMLCCMVMCALVKFRRHTMYCIAVTAFSCDFLLFLFSDLGRRVWGGASAGRRGSVSSTFPRGHPGTLGLDPRGDRAQVELDPSCSRHGQWQVSLPNGFIRQYAFVLSWKKYMLFLILLKEVHAILIHRRSACYSYYFKRCTIVHAFL